MWRAFAYTTALQEDEGPRKAGETTGRHSVLGILRVMPTRCRGG